MYSTSSYFFFSLIYVLTSSLLLSVPAFTPPSFAAASNSGFLFSSPSSIDDENDLLFPLDEATTMANSDSSPLFDPISISTTPSDAPLETEPFPPFLAAEFSSPSSTCSSFFSNNNNNNNYPQPLRRLRRGLMITNRQSSDEERGGGESCTAPPPSPPFKSQSGSESSSRSSSFSKNPNLDVGRLGIMDNTSESFCSEFVGWAFGNIAVCSVDDPEGVPSEEDLNEPQLLQMITLSGYRNFVDCFQITPFNFFLCPDNNVWCCNAFLPDINEPTTGKGFWCMRAKRKRSN